MSEKWYQRTITLGAREITLIVVGLAGLAAVLTLALVGLERFGRGAAQASEPTAAPVIAAAGSPTPAIVTPTAGTPPPTGEPLQTIQHVVRSGETLTSVAYLYGITPAALAAANSLSEQAFIQQGQSLSIPLTPGNEATIHTVTFGETLISIADKYGILPEVVQAANNLHNANEIVIGQQLVIPGGVAWLATATPAVTPTFTPAQQVMANGPALADWPRSILDGDYDTNYPLIYPDTRFTLHYQPGTWPERNLAEAAALFNEGFDHIEETMGVEAAEPLDIYLAGTLFEYPNAHLRGLNRPTLRKLFILLDGSGDRADRLYLVTHELTHAVARATWGAPSSTMLSEGLATYTGRQALEDGGYLPYQQVCLAAYAAGEMRSMAAIERDWQQFEGHIRHRFNYFGSGCFVDYLIQTYGLEAMSSLYNTSDYTALYGKSLADLDAEWFATLDTNQGELRVSAEEMSGYSNEVAEVYAYVFANTNGTELMHEAYVAADQARLALWRGDYEQVDFWVEQVAVITGFQAGGG
ncbi:MAG: LysM peptidoglycan-binding domain-containing protein [Anaerolineae bacterium]|nr:LysM peptidoglycan-binding domain-containing protein [Anaerolineae bacterium]